MKKVKPNSVKVKPLAEMPNIRSKKKTNKWHIRLPCERVPILPALISWWLPICVFQFVQCTVVLLAACERESFFALLKGGSSCRILIWSPPTQTDCSGNIVPRQRAVCSNPGIVAMCTCCMDHARSVFLWWILGWINGVKQARMGVLLCSF